MQLQRVGSETRHYLCGSHVGEVVFDRVVVGYRLVEQSVCLVVVAGEFVVSAFVFVAYVYKRVWYERVIGLVSHNALGFVHSACSHGNTEAYCVAIINGCVVALRSEVRFYIIQHGSSIVQFAEVKVHVSQIDLAQIHVECAHHAVLFE